MKYIINADDYGLHESCSKAIAKAFEAGLITDTTACGNGDYIEEAIRLAIEKGFVDHIGIHFNVTTGTPLTEEIRSSRTFCNKQGKFLKPSSRYFIMNKKDKKLLYNELMAQYKRLKDLGIDVNHADSHHHIHTSPAHMSTFIKVFHDCKIKKIRIIRTVGNMKPLKKAVSRFINAKRFRKHFTVTEHFGDVLGVTKYLDTSDKGIAEIMVHPDFDSKTGILIDRTGYTRGIPVGKNFEILEQFLKNNSIEFISYSYL